MESIKSCASMSQSLLYHLAERGADGYTYFDKHYKEQYRAPYQAQKKRIKSILQAFAQSMSQVKCNGYHEE